MTLVWRSRAKSNGRPVHHDVAPRFLSCVLLAASLVALSSGCSGRDEGVALTAAFNAQTKVGRVTAEWELTGQERSFADGVRLKEPEIEARFRVDVQNRLKDKVFLRLRDFRLVDEAGLVRGSPSPSPSTDCILGNGRTQGVLRGTLWLPASAAEDLESFRVDPFAVPLSDRGQALYREWLLQGRPGRETEVDAEIADLAAAPACAGVPN